LSFNHAAHVWMMMDTCVVQDNDRVQAMPQRRDDLKEPKKRKHFAVDAALSNQVVSDDAVYQGRG